MAQSYSPKKYYYNGSNFSNYTDFFHVFNIGTDGIEIYRFVKKYIDENDISSYDVLNATNFFNISLGETVNPIRSFTVDITKSPYCDSDKNVLKISDILEIEKFHLYSSTSLNCENLYLIPVIAAKIPTNSFSALNSGPNEDLIVTCDENNNFDLSNHNWDGKILIPAVGSLNSNYLFALNTGLKSFQRNFETQININDYNLIFMPYLKDFICNDANLNSFNTFSNFRLFDFPNRLKLSINGPSSGFIGDVLEYTVTLTNNNELVSNPPIEMETYPVVDAGQCSHRKLILKNGIGKFKVDTTNLSSGEKFDVKIGWKYITSDSKISVTLS